MCEPVSAVINPANIPGLRSAAWERDEPPGRVPDEYGAFRKAGETNHLRGDRVDGLGRLEFAPRHCPKAHTDTFEGIEDFRRAHGARQASSVNASGWWSSSKRMRETLSADIFGDTEEFSCVIEEHVHASTHLPVEDRADARSDGRKDRE